jgi:hypothetical protein
MTGLLGSAVLEVAIGLALLYLLLAIFCTTINEWIAGMLGARGKMLKTGLAQMLDGQPLIAGGNPLETLQRFYVHPLFTGFTANSKHPSYLSASSFAKTLMDLVTPLQPGSITYADLENGIKALPDGDVKRTLLALIQNTNSDLATAQQAIEGWFNDTMDRLSGWYKRRTQLWTFALAAVLTIAANADTFHVAQKLWTDPTLRSLVADTAKNRLAQPAQGVNSSQPATSASPAGSTGPSVGLSDEEVTQLGQMVGWPVTKVGGLDWLERLIGWFLTIVAVSLGAPFWFDTLNKFMNIRNAGKSPDEKPKT